MKLKSAFFHKFQKKKKNWHACSGQTVKNGHDDPKLGLTCMKELMLIDSGMVTEVSNGDFFGKTLKIGLLLR